MFPTSDSHYFDDKKMNTLLLNFTFPITNDLAKCAISSRDYCGDIGMGVARMSQKDLDGERATQVSPFEEEE